MYYRAHPVPDGDVFPLCENGCLSSGLPFSTSPLRCGKLNLRGRLDQLFYLCAKQIEVAHIPGVEMIRACLKGACRDQSVINGATHDSQPCHATDGGAVLLAVKPNQGKPMLDSLQQQACGFGTHPLFSGIAGEG